jgi:hypothetical protein
MEELNKIIDLYRSGKLARFAMEKELARAIDVPNATVKITDGNGGHVACSYVAGFVPHLEDGLVVPTLLIDNFLFIEAMNMDDISYMLSTISKRGMASVKDLSDFLIANNEAEVPMSQCLNFYVDLARTDFDALPKSITVNLTKFGVIDFSKINEASLALKLGKDKVCDIENMLINTGTLSKEHIEYAKRLFKAINKPLIVSDTFTGAIEPDMDVNWHKINNVADNTFDPSYSKQLPPDYTPNSLK